MAHKYIKHPLSVNISTDEVRALSQEIIPLTLRAIQLSLPKLSTQIAAF